MPIRVRTVTLLAITAGAVAAVSALSGFGFADRASSATAPAGVVLPALPASAVGEYAADSVHSSVIFQTTHAGVTNFYGRFNKLSGGFSLAENPVDSTFEFTIDTASVDTANGNRDNHLRGPDFFNAEQFPTATFKSTGITAAADGPHTLKGDLFLNGVTKPIEAELTLTGTGEFRGKPVAGFEAIFTINRSDFGITYGIPGIGDEVTVTVAVEGVKQ